MVDVIASQYGWTEDYILTQITADRALEYYQRIIARENGQTIKRCGAEVPEEIEFFNLLNQYEIIYNEQERRNNQSGSQDESGDAEAPPIPSQTQKNS